MKMNKASHSNNDGKPVSTGEMSAIKAMVDGVTVKALLKDDNIPAELELSFHWPNDIPKAKIDFILVFLKESYGYTCAFRYGTFGLELVYSENSNPRLIKRLHKTGKVMIRELGANGERTYERELKHCND